MTQDFKDKHIWIIGASTGIGAALAKELCSRGAILAVSARSEEKLQALKWDCGLDPIALPMDISKEADIKKNLKTLQEKWPRIDSVINMAAAYDPYLVGEIDLKKMRTIIDVNVTAAFTLVHHLLPVLKAQNNRPQIALCGSVAGYRGLPKGQPYCATKAAVINLAESLRAEEGDHIDVKLISPGFVKTPLTDKNDFEMPFIITPDAAAQYLANGLLRKSFEIHFPKQLTLVMKLLKFLPYPLYFAIAKAMVKKMNKTRHCEE